MNRRYVRELSEARCDVQKLACVWLVRKKDAEIETDVVKRICGRAPGAHNTWWTKGLLVEARLSVFSVPA